MNKLAELIKSELTDAIFNQNKEAITRLSIIIGERLEKLEKLKQRQKEQKKS